MGSLLDVVLGALIGLVAGIASGLAGIGGGVIMVPAMVFVLDFPQHLAQGTSLLAIVFTSTAATVVNRSNANVDVRLALTIGAIGAVAAFGAARLANLIDADVLRQMFGGFILLAGIRMLVQTRRAETPAEE
ncbi:MAG TPA: sulfite exporter TauE/SafE family protein [Acidimicrobiia bacterium]|nr:sulfite exporter TauE/SafE family protein [Acidimicrobiia bacterium]